MTSLHLAWRMPVKVIFYNLASQSFMLLKFLSPSTLPVED